MQIDATNLISGLTSRRKRLLSEANAALGKDGGEVMIKSIMAATLGEIIIALSDSTPTPLQEQKANSGKEGE